MKAAVLKDVGIFQVEDVPDLHPGPDEIKVKIAYCGICGSDIERFDGRSGLARLKNKKDTGIHGHEASGTVVELGSQVSKFKVGQRVAMNFRGTCGSCDYCRNNMELFCQNDYHATGAFAEYALYREGLLYPLADNISLKHGALLEPVSIALHIIDRSQIRPGSIVFISGAGSIGLLVLQLARLSGAARIMVSDPVVAKRKLALDLGADSAVDPVEDDVETAAHRFTDGKGFDVVLEASGSLKAAIQALSLAGKGGTVVWAATYPFEAEIGVNLFSAFIKELNIKTALLSPYSFPRALNLLPGIKFEPLITSIFPLQDIQEAFVLHKQGNQIKILIQP